jgi:hypothetical protein
MSITKKSKQKKKYSFDLSPVTADLDEGLIYHINMEIRTSLRQVTNDINYFSFDEVPTAAIESAIVLGELLVATRKDGDYIKLIEDSALEVMRYELKKRIEYEQQKAAAEENILF